MAIQMKRRGEKINGGNETASTVETVEGETPQAIHADRQDVRDRNPVNEDPSGYEIDLGCPVG
jgi:hypothetical protein